MTPEMSQPAKRCSPRKTGGTRKVTSADADRLLEWSDRILTAEKLADVFD